MIASTTMQPPTFIDLDSEARTPSAAGVSRPGFPSPRILHFDGDVPPSLSPLDAFAAHSRKLARELEETRKAGERRLSRLPPQVVTQALSDHHKKKPNVFRQLSDGPDSDLPPVPPLPKQDHDSAGSSPQLTNPSTRPVSSYPRHSAIPKLDQELEEDEAFTTPLEQPELTGLHQTSQPHDYFGGCRAESPPPLEPQQRDSPTKRKIATPQHILDAVSRQASTNSQFDSTFTLAPPNAAFARHRPYNESSDDDYTSSNAGSTFSQTRKLSSSSGVSISRSPASAHVRSHGRSDSNNSASSIFGHRKTPSQLNFSRPLSSASLSNLKAEALSRSASKSSLRSAPGYGVPKTSGSFDDARSELSEGFISGETSSYTHATYTLPRGRSDRTSVLFRGLSTPHFEWQEPMFAGTPPLENQHDVDIGQRLPEPSTMPSQETEGKQKQSEFSFEFDNDTSKFVLDLERRPSSSHNLTRSRLNSEANIRPSTSHTPTTSQTPFQAPPMPPVPFEELSHSSRSNSTVRPTTARTISNYQSLSADDHVTKAIELHEHGDLKESTYHLRIAAKQDHPTAMLLYALACRHGWGMRSNPKEALQWLRKAVDMAMMEVADDEDPTSNKPKADMSERKTHQAQFALGIYELGVSHMNGWGIEQDKALALRCFEIAGNWGDADALTEAGFCYAEGIGCKKNLKKAAKFYRMAEAKGVSMVGNSWIHKDKYNDDEDKDGVDRKSRSSRKNSNATTDGTAGGISGKPRSKSKTRSIFTRKKTG